MFEAYSTSKGVIVNVKTEYNLNELFECPNPNCQAKFIIKSATGKKAKHFSRLPSTPHIYGCNYDLKNEINAKNPNLITESLEDIYNNSCSKDKKTTNKTLNQNITIKNGASVTRISTPNQLFILCTNSDLDDVYKDNKKIGDIILDSRNLLINNNLLGITGLRLVVAETVKYERPNKLYLKLSVKTKSNKIPTLNIQVKMQPQLLDECIKYIFDTFTNKGFKGHSIAILADWKITEPYNISSTIKNKKHIMYKF